MCAGRAGPEPQHPRRFSMHEGSLPATLLPPSERSAEEGGLEAALFRLEERYARQCEELAALEAQLRALRTAAEICPECGGTGQRWIRGGFYGEIQRRPCGCQPG